MVLVLLAAGGRQDAAQETTMTRQADFKRRVRARMARTGESYAAARLRVLADRPAGGPAPTGRVLHVTHGDITVSGLRGTGLVDTVIAWRDVLHEGPVPDLPDEDLRRVRATFLAGENAADLGTVAEFAWRDKMIADHRDGDYVLWFEADLYDQLQVVQILARLRELSVPPDRITLICIGEHLGIAHFGGLGELSSEQLSQLPAIAATTLTDAALDYATRAWTALRATDPAGLGTIAATPSRELRFVAEAFGRLGREYPSTRDGLSLTERRILAAVAEGDGASAGPATAGQVFVRVGAREARPFLGDGWCFDRMTRLVQAPNAVLEADPPAPVDGHTRLSLTDVGRRLLDGREDHVALNGIDRWIGGVHLTGRAVAWRWNEGTESVTPTPA